MSTIVYEVNWMFPLKILWIVTRLKEQWCAQYSSGMQHRMVAFLVSILYYSSPDAFWCALLRLAVNNSRAI